MYLQEMVRAIYRNIDGLKAHNAFDIPVNGGSCSKSNILHERNRRLCIMNTGLYSNFARLKTKCPSRKKKTFVTIT